MSTPEATPKTQEASELHLALLAWKNGDITMIELKKFLESQKQQLLDYIQSNIGPDEDGDEYGRGFDDCYRKVKAHLKEGQ